MSACGSGTRVSLPTSARRCASMPPKSASRTSATSSRRAGCRRRCSTPASPPARRSSRASCRACSSAANAAGAVRLPVHRRGLARAARRRRRWRALAGARGRGIGVQTRDYEQIAIVATVSPNGRMRIPPGSDSCAPARSRCCRSPMAASPSSGRADEQLARELLAATAEEFEARACCAPAMAVLGATASGQRAAGVSLQRSPRRPLCRGALRAGGRCGARGPSAGRTGRESGVARCGGACAACASQARASGEDPGALRMLRRYERWRKSENQLMESSIDAFNRRARAWRGTASALGAVARWRWVNRSALLKRFFIARTGTQRAAAAAAQPGNLIDLRCADEVVFGQSADGVRAVATPGSSCSPPPDPDGGPRCWRHAPVH